MIFIVSIIFEKSIYIGIRRRLIFVKIINEAVVKVNLIIKNILRPIKPAIKTRLKNQIGLRNLKH